MGPSAPVRAEHPRWFAAAAVAASAAPPRGRRSRTSAARFTRRMRSLACVGSEPPPV